MIKKFLETIERGRRIWRNPAYRGNAREKNNEGNDNKGNEEEENNTITLYHRLFSITQENAKS